MGAWSVSLILHTRHGGPSSGYVSSGFYGGMWKCTVVQQYSIMEYFSQGLILGRVALIPINKMVRSNRISIVHEFILFLPLQIGETTSIFVYSLICIGYVHFRRDKSWALPSQCYIAVLS